MLLAASKSERPALLTHTPYLKSNTRSVKHKPPRRASSRQGHRITITPAAEWPQGFTISGASLCRDPSGSLREGARSCRRCGKLPVLRARTRGKPRLRRLRPLCPWLSRAHGRPLRGCWRRWSSRPGCHAPKARPNLVWGARGESSPSAPPVLSASSQGRAQQVLNHEPCMCHPTSTVSTAWMPS